MRLALIQRRCRVTKSREIVGSESARRRSLGIPDTATEVVTICESTHWDPNWLMRADTYHRWFVAPALDRVIDELEAEPRRVFGIECLFFMDRYWRERPDRHDQIRDLVARRRLVFTGSGVTTPDTLLPDDELILRDLLAGQEWLRDRSLASEGRLLYLPDSFGHTPGLAALARAAGFDRVAVSRIAGMRFPGADMEPADRFPRPGTAAAELLSCGSADFVWRSSDGSEVLAHWMAHSYGHGDMLASRGVTRLMGLPLSLPDRRPRAVDRRIDRYRRDLTDVAVTPYRLLAIGFDFVRPIPRLIELIDRWNERNHDRTGAWLVNGTIDDHLDLVEAHRHRLPVLEFDPNPYWMGFYASRPALKSAARELGRRLLAREAAAVGGGTSLSPAVLSRDRELWWTAVTANHHDFITGTSPDRVARGEQALWLARAIDEASWPEMPDLPEPVGVIGPQAQPRVTRAGGQLIVATDWATLTFDSHRGGALVSLVDTSGHEWLTGPSLEIESHLDSGGLWRLGQEIHGGTWRHLDRSSAHGATISSAVEPDGRAVRIEVAGWCDRRPVRLVHVVDLCSPAVVTTTDIHPRRRRSVTLVVRWATAFGGLTMHQPGGVVQRPLERWYRPTFWPLHSFAIAEPSGSQRAAGLAVAVATPTALTVAGDGTVAVMVARTPFKEMAFGAVPVMAPAWGWHTEAQQSVSAWCLGGVDSGVGVGSGVGIGRTLVALVDRAAGRQVPSWPVRISRSSAAIGVGEDGDLESAVEVVAAKPAWRGEGVVIRLRDWEPGPGRTVCVEMESRVRLREARLVDARERDLGPLAVTDSRWVEVPLTGHLTSVRLVT